MNLHLSATEGSSPSADAGRRVHDGAVAFAPSWASPSIASSRDAERASIRS